MLSAFTPQPIVELKPRDKSKIESILASGDKLLVGLNTGSFRVYRVNEGSIEQNQPTAPVSDTQQHPQTKPPVVELLREVEDFSARAIQQLAIVKEGNILLALSDGYVSIYDLQSYTLQEQLSKTKGATAFAVTSNIVKDLSTGIPSIVSRLAVPVKRKILVWSWHDAELSSDVLELTLAAPARNLIWATATKIVCGMNSGYVLLNIDTQETTDILIPGGAGSAGQDGGRFGAVGGTGIGYMGIGSWVPKPLATRLADGELLLAKDINTMFIDLEGKALDKRQIPWSSAPEAIAYSYPYLLALQTPAKGTLEVRNAETRSLLQSISLPNISLVHVPQPNISLAHAGKGFLVASDRCIWRMDAEGYGSQTDQLVEQGQYDEAISLLEMLEDALLVDKPQRLREIKSKKAQMLFDQRKYRAALDLFTEASAPPERVIQLYPPSVAGDLSIIGTADNHEDDTQSVAQTEGKATPQGKRKGLRAMIMQKEASLDGDDTRSVVSQSVDGNASKSSLEDQGLADAVSELVSFLADIRRKLQKYLNPDGTLRQDDEEREQDEEWKEKIEPMVGSAPEDAPHWAEKLGRVASLVDTTLFRAYMLSRPALAGSLFRIANFCDPDVVNEKLLETGRYSELIDFLHGKKLHRQALDLLKRFGQAKGDDTEAPALRGPKRTVGYLQTLPPTLIDLILEFVAWPLAEDPDLAMEVFIADSENAETLPRGRVVAFLYGFDRKLLVRYLEHLIAELNDLTPEFHQRLVFLYLERLKGQQQMGDFNSAEERAEWRQRLLSHLRSSRQYSTAKALSQIPREDPEFYDARAIVLSNMGQHKQALEIYVFKLKDPQKAEEYCNQVYLSQIAESTRQTGVRRSSLSTHADGSQPSIYQALLSLYLDPAPPQKPDWGPALNLLAKHGARLPASSTLNLIPSPLPINDLESYFRGRIRNNNAIVNEGRVVTGLSKTELVGAQARLILGDGTPSGNAARNRRVVVGEHRVCGVCHKRLGRSVISVMPDNSVVHLGCATRAQQPPQSPRSFG
ncbi:MAG: Vacuolar morphogenesis protein 6 [Caeruleum heppii]|nr:MAG: Vacuolar morphogenesis protein 6 [Caeruleum heppii]